MTNNNYNQESEQLTLNVRDIRVEEPAYALREEVRRLERWITEAQEEGAFLYIKRLSANDTSASESHQGGIYLPGDVTREAIPSVSRTDVKNPEYFLPCAIDSHGDLRGEVRAIYYNNKYFRKDPSRGRNEARLTRWAWKGSDSPIQNPDNAGALAVFSFSLDKPRVDARALRVWVCNSPGEEEMVEREFGEVLPGEALAGYADRLGGGAIFTREAEPDLDTPEQWATTFPSGSEILEYLFSLSGFESLDPDERLMKRRELEYKVYRKVELDHVMPLIREGFRDVDEFMAVANSVANRRKSRSGRSLELHLRKIFQEEGLPTVGEQCVTEAYKKPDFIFPDCKAYHDYCFPAEKLRMLGVKTTCKDRWRQVLSEAQRIEAKHLFTLQEGVSVNQHSEMREANVTLVVPRGIHKKYPRAVRGHVMTLSDFVGEARNASY